MMLMSAFRNGSEGSALGVVDYGRIPLTSIVQHSRNRRQERAEVRLLRTLSADKIGKDFLSNLWRELQQWGFGLILSDAIPMSLWGGNQGVLITYSALTAALLVLVTACFLRCEVCSFPSIMGVVQPIVQSFSVALRFRTAGLPAMIAYKTGPELSSIGSMAKYECC
jgi:hypothetical protein